MARALRFLPGFTQSRPFKASLKMEPQFAPALTRSRRPVRVLHPEDLILLKLGAGGPQDLSDAGGFLADPPPQLNLNRAPIPTHRELDAERALSRDEHSRFLRLCEIGEDFARHLHGVKPTHAKARAALKKIIEAGHDIEEDGSIFCCALCWNTAQRYAATGRLNGFTT